VEKFLKNQFFFFEKSGRLESKFNVLEPTFESFDFDQIIKKMMNFAEYYYYDPALYEKDEPKEFHESV